MFEHELRRISRDIFQNKNPKKYFILTNKKHRREMCFKIGDKRIINFAKSKFNSKKKKIIFFLLKVRILPLFLKKIHLSSEMGEVIFVGDQIKGFDLNKKLTNSFCKQTNDCNLFIQQKLIQKKLGDDGFAPKIIRLDEKRYFSKEELFCPYQGKSRMLFERIFQLYTKSRISKKNTRFYLELISKSLDKRFLNNHEIKKAIKLISKKKYFLETKIHGEFAKEQCLIDSGKIYFVDWSLRKGLITEDLVNYFRGDREYFKKLEFKVILGLYPKDVNLNLKEYLILTSILRMIYTPISRSLEIQRIKNLIN